jgi:hypothetical protein
VLCTCTGTVTTSALNGIQTTPYDNSIVQPADISTSPVSPIGRRLLQDVRTCFVLLLTDQLPARLQSDTATLPHVHACRYEQLHSSI